jgi:predicted ribosomally synthesized peptide with SipW-like signal peptide
MENLDRGSGTQSGASRLRYRRVGAILAGGLVVGVGAAVSLAAWNDSEFATGDFASGSMNLVGSVDGVSYTDHDTEAGAALLDFAVEGAGLAPGDVVYAPFAVRLDEATDYDATVTVASAGTTGAIAGLTYSVVRPTSFGCDDTTTGDQLIPAGTLLDAVPAGTTFTLQPGTDPAAGEPAYLCFAVTAGPTLEPSQSGTATWEFAAESQ